MAALQEIEQAESAREIIMRCVKARLDEIGDGEYRIPLEGLALFERLNADAELGTRLRQVLWNEMGLSIVQDCFVTCQIARRDRSRQAMAQSVTDSEDVKDETLTGLTIFVPGRGTINLLKATKIDLLKAAEHRAPANVTGVTEERLQREIARHLADGQITEELFTAEDIALMRAELEEQTRMELTSFRAEYKRFKPRAFQDRKGAKD